MIIGRCIIKDGISAGKFRRFTPQEQALAIAKDCMSKLMNKNVSEMVAIQLLSGDIEVRTRAG